MIEKKKICLIIPSLQAGGMERVMSELADCFAETTENEIHLVLYGKNREMFFNLKEKVRVHKPTFTFNDKWRFISTLRTMVFIRRKLKSLDPDTVLSFGEYWNNFVLLSCLGLGLKIYVSDRSQPNKSLGSFHDFLRKRVYPRATGIILQTEIAKKIYTTKFRHSNIRVIGNPIRLVSSNTEIQRENIIVMVGRLIESKHQDQLIEIFSSTQNEGWKLMIVGYDHLKQQHMERLKKLALDLGVADKVIFTGKSDNVDELYLQSKIFAFTSSSEGFPNVIGEAMSAGLPVVSYDCVAGPSDMIIHGENGFLVPLFDKEAFRDHLSILMKDEELLEKMGQKASESIKRFERSKICSDFYEFINS